MPPWSCAMSSVSPPSLPNLCPQHKQVQLLRHQVSCENVSVQCPAQEALVSVELSSSRLTGVSWRWRLPDPSQHKVPELCSTPFTKLPTKGTKTTKQDASFGQTPEISVSPHS